MGRKNKAITIQCPWKYKKRDEISYLGGEEGIK